MEIEEIKKIVKKTLSEKRYYHSLCVMERAKEIAKKTNVDIEIAAKVGIAHDIAKEFSKQDTIKYVKENKIIADEIEKQNVGLLHAKVGADICKKNFLFSEQMAKAIEAHTTGKPEMTELDKVLYLADASSKDRKWEDLDDLNKLIDKDMDRAILYMLDITIVDNLKKQKQIHLDTINLRNNLIKILTNK